MVSLMAERRRTNQLMLLLHLGQECCFSLVKLFQDKTAAFGQRSSFLHFQTLLTCKFVKQMLPISGQFSGGLESSITRGASLARILPVGVESKNAIGARKILFSILLKSFSDVSRPAIATKEARSSTHSELPTARSAFIEIFGEETGRNNRSKKSEYISIFLQPKMIMVCYYKTSIYHGTCKGQQEAGCPPES
ncbi:hypothetical protein ACJIZ3_007744 [Penstemon smallii]|uniref:Uncharacterized protein n=1 Tax=Penstemon smallii TaxID=265156 RepID=A0ABD3T9B0_9LAMI